MTPKHVAILGALLFIAGLAAGRWAAPTKVVTETKTVEVEKKSDAVKSDLDVDKHKETTTTVVRKPDGSEETVTKVTENSHADRKRDEVKTDQVDKSSTVTKEVTYSSAKVTLSALGGLSLSGIPTPVYGASISKPILGPITVGGFYLSNQTLGVSVGLTF